MGKRISNKSAGFSLVEALVVTGLVSVLALGLSQLMSGSSISSKNVQESVDFSNLNAAILTVTANVNACNAAFAGMSLDPTGAFPQPIPDIKVGALDIAKVSASTNGLQITKLQFQKGSTLSVSGTVEEYLADIHLETKKNIFGTKSAQLLSRDFIVALEIDTTTKKIIQCGGGWPPGKYCIIGAQNQNCPTGFTLTNPVINPTHSWGHPYEESMIMGDLGSTRSTVVTGLTTSRFTTTMVGGASVQVWWWCCK